MVSILKVSNGDDVRRLTVKGDLTFDMVMKMIWDEWPAIGVAGGHAVKYIDDEGDLCTLAPATFDDFVALFFHGAAESNARPVGKLQVVALPPPATPPPTATVESHVVAAPPPTQTTVPTAPTAPTAPAAWAGPPPGLGGSAEHVDAQQSSSSSSGGPWKVLKVVQSLQADGVLTPKMLASITVQWLPMLAQRVTRKLEKIHWFTRSVPSWSPTLRSFIESLIEVCAAYPAFEEHASKFRIALADDAGDCGLAESLCGFLKALQNQPFETQVEFVERLYAELVPLIAEINDQFDPGSVQELSQTHDAACDGCNMQPIRGPRFRCQTCDDYDLCGNCYTRKDSIHARKESIHAVVDSSGEKTAHNFHCILLPPTKPKESKGHGKGHHPWKGWKGHWMEQAGLDANGMDSAYLHDCGSDMMWWHCARKGKGGKHGKHRSKGKDFFDWWWGNTAPADQVSLSGFDSWSTSSVGDASQVPPSALTSWASTPTPSVAEQSTAGDKAAKIEVGLVVQAKQGKRVGCVTDVLDSKPEHFCIKFDDNGDQGERLVKRFTAIDGRALVKVAKIEVGLKVRQSQSKRVACVTDVLDAKPRKFLVKFDDNGEESERRIENFTAADGRALTKETLRVEAAEFKPLGLDDNEGKLNFLREMVGQENEPLIKDLLETHNGDHMKVAQILTSE